MVIRFPRWTSSPPTRALPISLEKPSLTSDPSSSQTPSPADVAARWKALRAADPLAASAALEVVDQVLRQFGA